jgi:hypothetical protein
MNDVSPTLYLIKTIATVQIGGSANLYAALEICFVEFSKLMYVFVGHCLNFY